MTQDISIFISYASPDRDRLTPFFDYLQAHGFNVGWTTRVIADNQTLFFGIAPSNHIVASGGSVITAE
jgi:hypothetical protein